ncbi:MAG: 3-methyl-2-oxobutanoate hydroxymethyltransferase [Acidobacteriia bacterium]|nr:3-methyl-2-oxobutanoate hydroxymethyltransferase [Terriglobia bacterium]
MSQQTTSQPAKVTVPKIYQRKFKPEKITCLTAYDFTMARIVDEAGIDIILVGDSVGMVQLGYDSTLPVGMEEMLMHVRAVRRGVVRALLVADMPYGSFQINEEEAVRNALRFVKEGGAEAVKLEGGVKRASLVNRLMDAEVPVMGHVGLTPQSLLNFGGFKVQGQTEAAGERILEDALALDEAGVFSIVLEGIPRDLAQRITTAVKAPTIGIGAGPDCDGQVLVLNDLLGLNSGRVPKFVRQYAHLRESAAAAISEFIDDVHNSRFPSDQESYHSETSHGNRIQSISNA